MILCEPLPFISVSQSNENNFLFKENKGQFDKKVNFKSNISNGNFFLTQTGFTYSFYDKSRINYNELTNDNYNTLIKCHAVEVEFDNCNTQFSIQKNKKSSHYYNYFQGVDSTKWATEIFSYNEVVYENIYDDIDFKIYEYQEAIKYDFIVKPLADVSEISFRYQGQEKAYRA